MSVLLQTTTTSTFGVQKHAHIGVLHRDLASGDVLPVAMIQTAHPEHDHM